MDFSRDHYKALFDAAVLEAKLGEYISWDTAFDLFAHWTPELREDAQCEVFLSFQ